MAASNRSIPSPFIGCARPICEVCGQPVAQLHLGPATICCVCYLAGRTRERELGNDRVRWIVRTVPAPLGAQPPAPDLTVEQQPGTCEACGSSGADVILGDAELCSSCWVAGCEHERLAGDRPIVWIADGRLAVS